MGSSFRIQGNPDTPAGINGVSFRPTLRVVVQNVAGSVSGTVTSGVDTLAVDVEGLTVVAEAVDPGDDEEFQSHMATTTTGADGTYMIPFLAPGTYTVTVETGDGLTTSPASVEVEVGPSEAVTEVDFEIVAS